MVEIRTSCLVRAWIQARPLLCLVPGEFCAFYFLFHPVSRVVPGEFNRFQGWCWVNSARFIFYFTGTGRILEQAQLSILNRPYYHDGGQAQKRPYQSRQSSGPNQARQLERTKPSTSRRWRLWELPLVPRTLRR